MHIVVCVVMLERRPAIVVFDPAVPKFRESHPHPAFGFSEMLVEILRFHILIKIFTAVVTLFIEPMDFIHIFVFLILIIFFRRKFLLFFRGKFPL